MRSVIIAWYI